MASDYVLIYITAPSGDEAGLIARTIVSERLAACANIFSGISSLYWWDGAVQEDSEVAIAAKTRSDLVEALIARVKELHSYECPCIVALPIVAGNQPFLDWIGAETLTAS